MKKLFCCLIVLLVYCLIANSVWAAPLVLNDGPHLFLDDYLIESSSGLERYARISNYPRTKIIDGMESVEVYSTSRKWKPNAVSDWPVEVHYNPNAPADEKFRMWHETFLFDNHTCSGKDRIRTMVHRISSDGIHFSSPGTELNYDCSALAYAFSSVVDDKTGSDRYKTIYGPLEGDTRGAAPGRVAVSSDGIKWELTGRSVTEPNYDEIWAPFWDPKYQRYGVLHRDLVSHVRKRLYYGETGNFYNWPASSLAFSTETETGNFGKTEYYGASNTIRRGDYLIFAKRILRDDLKAKGIPDEINNQQWGPGQKFLVYGVGYSVLAWSRDGEVDQYGKRIWHRDKPKQEYVISGNILDGWGLYNDLNIFFAPDPNHASQVADPNDPYSDSTPFDHAHAWVNTLLEMPAGVNGEELPMVYIYYGGYKYGHKIYTDRSLGLVKIKKDRFVGRREWGNSGGSGKIETPWIQFDATSLALNLDTAAGDRMGSVKVEIQKQGDSWKNCGTFSGIDEIAKEVTNCNIAQFANQPVKLRFTITDAYLFAFYLDGEESGPTATPTVTPTPNPNAGQALKLDGINNAIVIANENNFDFTAGNSITLETWIKPTGITAGQNEIIISKGKDDYPKHFRFYIAGVSPGRGKLVFFYDDQNNQRHIYQTGDDLVVNNQWQHVALTYTYGQGSSAKLYLNGGQVSGSWTPGSGNLAPKLVDNPVMLGAEESAGSNERYNGLIDEARIYKRALSANEISSHYNSGQGQYGRSDEPGLLAGWHLDNNLSDYSGNGNNGNLDGNPQWVEGLVAIANEPTSLLELIQNYLKTNTGFDLNSDGVVNGLDFVAAVLW